MPGWTPFLHIHICLTKDPQETPGLVIGDELVDLSQAEFRDAGAIGATNALDIAQEHQSFKRSYLEQHAVSQNILKKGESLVHWLWRMFLGNLSQRAFCCDFHYSSSTILSCMLLLVPVKAETSEPLTTTHFSILKRIDLLSQPGCPHPEDETWKAEKARCFCTKEERCYKQQKLPKPKRLFARHSTRFTTQN